MPGQTGTDAPQTADEVIADLRSRLEGQKLVLGSSAFPDTSIMGLFKTVDFLREDFGVEVDLKLLDSDPLVAATISGSVEVGGLSLAGVANVNAAGADFVAFGNDDQKNPFIIIARPPIDSIEELRGQPFAVTSNINQITGQTARKCLEQAGLDIEKDVQLIRLNNAGDATEAVVAGQVAGGVSATFFLTQLILDHGEDAFNILCKGWEMNPQISTVFYAARQWIVEHEDMALAINIAWLRAARWMAEDKQRWIDYAIENVDGLTPEAAEIDYETLVKELDNWPVNGGLDRGLLQTTLDTSYEFGVIEDQLSVDEVSIFEFQERALEILGPCPGGLDCPA